MLEQSLASPRPLLTAVQAAAITDAIRYPENGALHCRWCSAAAHEAHTANCGFAANCRRVDKARDLVDSLRGERGVELPGHTKHQAFRLLEERVLELQRELADWNLIKGESVVVGRLEVIKLAAARRAAADKPPKPVTPGITPLVPPNYRNRRCENALCVHYRGHVGAHSDGTPGARVTPGVVTDEMRTDLEAIRLEIGEPYDVDAPGGSAAAAYEALARIEALILRSPPPTCTCGALLEGRECSCQK